MMKEFPKTNSNLLDSLNGQLVQVITERTFLRNPKKFGK